jgi:predicted DCC family thiol-disulfide oxidoreductase YuxK
MDEERRFASAHLVTRDGRVLSGGDAVPSLARELPGGRALAALARLVPAPVWRVGYDWVAARRGTFGPRIPRRAVARATARIDAHG